MLFRTLASIALSRTLSAPLLEQSSKTGEYSYDGNSHQMTFTGELADWINRYEESNGTSKLVVPRKSNMQHIGKTGMYDIRCTQPMK